MGFVWHPAASPPPHPALPRPHVPSAAAAAGLPGCGQVAGREAGLVGARGPWASESLVKRFRPGRGPPVSVSPDGFQTLVPPCHAPPTSPFGLRLLQSCRLPVSTFGGAPQCSPSLALSGVNPSLPGYTRPLLSSGNQKWQMAAWCLRHLHR